MLNSFKAHNYAIDAVKIIMIFAVISHHSYRLPHVKGMEYFKVGYIAVECFCIISGYLMAKTALERKSSLPLGMQTRLFLWEKFKKLMPLLLFGDLMAFIASHIGTESSPYSVVKHAVYAIWEPLLFRMSGVLGYWSNTATWYLSAMLVAMALIYPMLKRNADIFLNLIAPLGTFFLLGFLSKTQNDLYLPYAWIGFIYKGMLRMILAILLGCLCYAISRKLSQYQVTTLTRALLTVVEIAGYTVSMFLMAIKTPSQLDFIILLILWCCVVITCSQLSFSNTFCSKVLFRYSGRYTIALFLCHLTCAHFFTNHTFGLPYQKLFWVYLLTALVWSAASLWIVDAMVTASSKLVRRYGYLFVQEAGQDG